MTKENLIEKYEKQLQRYRELRDIKTYIKDYYSAKFFDGQCIAIAIMLDDLRNLDGFTVP